MTVMPGSPEKPKTRLPVHLLAPYVAAGAREVLAGKELSSWLEDAIKDAEYQLDVERIAIQGRGVSKERRAAALVAAGGASLELAGLALEASGGLEDRPTAPADQIDDAAERLGQIVSELENVRSGNKVAAAEVSRIFGVIVDRVLSRSTPL